MRISRLVVAAMAAAMALGTGCSTRTGLLRIQIPEYANPESGTAVRLAKVTDDRVFAADEKDRTIENLPRSHFGKPDVQARAVAYHHAGPAQKRVFQLTDDETVAGLVGKTVTRSLREAGYRVTEENVVDAIPLEVEIRHLWTWWQRGMWVIAVHARGEVLVRGPLPGLEQGVVIQANTTQRAPALTAGLYHQTILQTLGRLETDLQEKLKAAKPAP